MSRAFLILLWCSLLALPVFGNANADERGGLIGKIGATGRATGPHLDWRIDWQGRRIDPVLLVGAMPDPAT